MKRKLSERSYANITELEEAVNVAWADIKITTINKLIESFAARCLAVLEANGECINDLLQKKFSPLEWNDVLGRKLLDLFVSKEGKWGLIARALGTENIRDIQDRFRLLGSLSKEKKAQAKRNIKRSYIAELRKRYQANIEEEEDSDDSDDDDIHANPTIDEIVHNDDALSDDEMEAFFASLSDSSCVSEHESEDDE